MRYRPAGQRALAATVGMRLLDLIVSQRLVAQWLRQTFLRNVMARAYGGDAARPGVGELAARGGAGPAQHPPLVDLHDVLTHRIGGPTPFPEEIADH